MNQVTENSEVKRLLNKSIEAFILGLEIYNKPTLQYRIEGFSLFIVNAWELMLKAELLKRGDNIFFTDDPERTISVQVAIARIYTDINTRIRLNLEKIIELRNLSTHYITEDYEIKYAPLFQACVLNFVNEFHRFHDYDVTLHIAHNFLTISAKYEPLSNEQVRLKYSAEVAEKFIKQANDIEILSTEYDSDKFAINVKQNLYITKKHSDSDFSVSISRDSETKVEIVKELKDPSDTHKYTYNIITTVVSERLKKLGIKLGYNKGFTTHVLGLFISFYNIKGDAKYSYKHVLGNSESYTYSQQLIEFIIDEIKKNPETFVESLKQ